MLPRQIQWFVLDLSYTHHSSPCLPKILSENKYFNTDTTTCLSSSQNNNNCKCHQKYLSLTKNISLKTLVAHGVAMVMGHCSDLVTGVMGTHLSNSIHTYTRYSYRIYRAVSQSKQSGQLSLILIYNIMNFQVGRTRPEHV